MQNVNNFLLCFQTPYDSIKYITNDMASPSHLSYHKFMDYIKFTIHVNFFSEFQDELDKFKTILINTDTHDWEIYEEEKDKIGFKNLFDFNEKRNEEKLKEKNKNKIGDIESKKNFINKVAHGKNKFKHTVIGFRDPFFRNGK